MRDEKDIEVKEEKDEALSYEKIVKKMDKIVYNHRNHTLMNNKKIYAQLDIYFDKGVYYEYSILEKFYYSEAIFTKKGCYYFIHILDLLKKYGMNKLTRGPLKNWEKEKIDKEIKELKEMVKFFNENQNFNSPYLRDRFAARDFEENLTYDSYKSLKRLRIKLL